MSWSHKVRDLRDGLAQVSSRHGRGAAQVGFISVCKAKDVEATKQMHEQVQRDAEQFAAGEATR
ncbi:MAG: hypothetical protein RL077_334 [Verrucomicrobiota bacterium]|jgi:uncharacterized pyridoxal phosphate-containing UPF0001 family protein